MSKPTAQGALSAHLGESPAPAYARVKQMITQQILSGTWPPNHRVPSESELVGELGFSRMTINRALRELTAEGFLVRMQGVGTFVAEPQEKGQAALFAVQNIADEITSRGHQHSTDVIVLEQVTATPERALALDVREGQPLYHSLLVHHENGMPVQIEERYVNPAVAPDYLEQDFTRTTPNAYLTEMAPMTEGEHLVEAVLATARECQLLKIEPGEPCLLIRRRTWSGRFLVSNTRLLYPGTRYRLEGKFAS